MRAALLACLPLLASATPVPSGEVIVNVGGLRSAKGNVLACLTTLPSAFPDCSRDPYSRKLTAPALPGETLRFAALPPGRYAVSLLHDENGNGKADMALFVPREGFGFSRDAAVRLGPPRFASAAFPVADAPVTMPIKMRYVF